VTTVPDATVVTGPPPAVVARVVVDDAFACAPAGFHDPHSVTVNTPYTAANPIRRRDRFSNGAIENEKSVASAKGTKTKESNKAQVALIRQNIIFRFPQWTVQ
jgi:hypothetical protein